MYHGIFFSALKRKKILVYATAYMHLESIVLSEISPSQQTNMV